MADSVPLLPPHVQGRDAAASGSRCGVRAVIIVLLTTAPVVLLILRGVPSVAVAGPHGIVAEQGWSNTEKGVFLGSFFYGYISSQALGGWLSSQQRLGGKRMMLLCVGASCVLSLITPLSITQHGLHVAMAARVVEGFAQGPLFPTMWGLVGAWLPPHEISMGACLANSGFSIGTMVTFFAAPTLMSALGWEALFYLPSGLGAVWVVAWLALGADSPRQHGSVPASELRHIEQHRLLTVHNTVQQQPQPQPPPPLLQSAAPASSPAAAAGWREMVRSPALYGQICVDIAQNYFFYVVFTFLPQYLSDALGFSNTHAAWLTGANILVNILSINLSGVLGDWAISRGWSRLVVRNACVAAASLVPMACLLTVVMAAGHSESNALILGLILTTHFFAGINAAGSYCVVLDLFPHGAGSFSGIDNTIAQSMGIFAPTITGLLLDAGHCPSTSRTSSGESGSGVGGDASGSSTGRGGGGGGVPASCLEAWHRVFGICIALFTVGWVLFAGLTMLDKRYRRY